MVKNPLANSGDIRDSGSISGSGRYSGGRNGNPLQYFCPENPINRVAWLAIVHGVTKSPTRLKPLSTQWPLTKVYRKNMLLRKQYWLKETPLEMYCVLFHRFTCCVYDILTCCVYDIHILIV